MMPPKHDEQLVALNRRILESALDIFGQVGLVPLRDLQWAASDGAAAPYAQMPPPWYQQSVKRGEQLPVYKDIAQLQLIRDRSRILSFYNEFALCGIANRRDYVVGGGFKLKAEPVRPSSDKGLVNDVQQFIDALADMNELDQIEAEACERCDTEGEAFLRLFPQSSGFSFIRFIEPEHVWPPNGDSWDPAMSFGIETDRDDVETVKAYWVKEKPIESQTPTRVSADLITHLKFNVRRNAKRGIPTYFPVEQNLRRCEDLLASMTSLAKTRAKIALIRKLTGVASNAAENLVNALTQVKVSDPGTGEQLNVERLRYGTILTTSGNTDYEMPALTVGASDIVEVLQAELRAVASRLQMPEWMFTALADAKYSNAFVVEAPTIKAFTRIQEYFVRNLVEARYGNKASLLWKAVRLAVACGLLSPKVLSDVKLCAEAPSLEARDKASEATTFSTYVTNGIISKKQVREKLDYDDKDTQKEIDKETEHDFQIELWKQKQQQNAAPPPTGPGQQQAATPESAFNGAITDALGRTYHYVNGKRTSVEAERGLPSGQLNLSENFRGDYRRLLEAENFSGVVRVAGVEERYCYGLHESELTDVIWLPEAITIHMFEAALPRTGQGVGPANRPGLQGAKVRFTGTVVDKLGRVYHYVDGKRVKWQHATDYAGRKLQFKNKAEYKAYHADRAQGIVDNIRQTLGDRTHPADPAKVRQAILNLSPEQRLQAPLAFSMLPKVELERLADALGGANGAWLKNSAMHALDKVLPVPATAKAAAIHAESLPVEQLPNVPPPTAPQDAYAQLVDHINTLPREEAYAKWESIFGSRGDQLFGKMYNAEETPAKIEKPTEPAPQQSPAVAEQKPAADNSKTASDFYDEKHPRAWNYLSLYSNPDGSEATAPAVELNPKAAKVQNEIAANVRPGDERLSLADNDVPEGFQTTPLKSLYDVQAHMDGKPASDAPDAYSFAAVSGPGLQAGRQHIVVDDAHAQHIKQLELAYPTAKFYTRDQATKQLSRVAATQQARDAAKAAKLATKQQAGSPAANVATPPPNAAKATADMNASKSPEEQQAAERAAKIAEPNPAYRKKQAARDAAAEKLGAAPPAASAPVAAPPASPSIRTDNRTPSPDTQTPVVKQPVSGQASLISKIRSKAKEADLNDAMGAGRGVDAAFDIKALPKDVGSRFDAHGTGTLDSLTQLLNGGIDPSRTFHTENLGTVGTSQGTAGLKSNSSFIVLGQPGKTLKDGGVGGVIVDGHHAGAIPELEKAFPGVKFIAADKAAKLLPKVAKGAKAVDYDAKKPSVQPPVDEIQKILDKPVEKPQTPPTEDLLRQELDKPAPAQQAPGEDLLAAELNKPPDEQPAEYDPFKDPLTDEQKATWAKKQADANKKFEEAPAATEAEPLATSLDGLGAEQDPEDAGSHKLPVGDNHLMVVQGKDSPTVSLAFDKDKLGKLDNATLSGLANSLADRRAPVAVHSAPDDHVKAIEPALLAAGYERATASHDEDGNDVEWKWTGKKSVAAKPAAEAPVAAKPAAEKPVAKPSGIATKAQKRADHFAAIRATYANAAKGELTDADLDALKLESLTTDELRSVAASMDGYIIPPGTTKVEAVKKVRERIAGAAKELPTQLPTTPQENEEFLRDVIAVARGQENPGFWPDAQAVEAEAAKRLAGGNKKQAIKKLELEWRDAKEQAAK